VVTCWPARPSPSTARPSLPPLTLGNSLSDSLCAVRSARTLPDPVRTVPGVPERCGVTCVTNECAGSVSFAGPVLMAVTPPVSYAGSTHSLTLTPPLTLTQPLTQPLTLTPTLTLTLTQCCAQQGVVAPVCPSLIPCPKSCSTPPELQTHLRGYRAPYIFVFILESINPCCYIQAGSLFKAFEIVGSRRFVHRLQVLLHDESSGLG
jgi:hypothetical protein